MEVSNHLGDFILLCTRFADRIRLCQAGSGGILGELRGGMMCAWLNKTPGALEQGCRSCEAGPQVSVLFLMLSTS